MATPLEHGKAADVRALRHRTGTGAGAESAFGEMLKDRPLVHRPAAPDPTPVPRSPAPRN